MKILGNQKVRQGLLESLARSGPASSYLFLGDSGLGKSRTALWLASALNCSAEDRPCGVCPSCLKIAHSNHPDVVVQERPAGKTGIGVGDVREQIAATAYRPYEGRHRVWIVAEAETLTEEAQNALLKTLEEPPGNMVMVLISSSESALLPTVSSRCRPVRFQSVPPEELWRELEERGAEPEQARTLAHLARGRPGVALGWLENKALWELRCTTLDLLSGLHGAQLWPALETAARLDKLRAGEEARVSLAAVLDTCRLFYRDLLHLAASGAEGPVVNRDRLDDLRRLAAEGGIGRPRKALELLLEASEHLQANLNGRLVLQRLCLHLSRC